MSLDAEKGERLLAELEKRSKLLDLLTNGTPPASNATITVQGGGVWTVVAMFAAGIMFGINIVLGVIVLDHSRQISDLQDYKNVIYASLPDLKKKSEKENK